MRGILPRPDMIVMADTGRENPMTWDYLATNVRPLLATVGLDVQIAGHELAKNDLYSGNGDLLVPAYTATGKLQGFCSSEWKKRVVDRHVRAAGITGGTRWLGMAYDEQRRWRRHHNVQDGQWLTVCPLVDLLLNTSACLDIIQDAGLPVPHHSACWMCPHKQNSEWRVIRDQHPAEWQQAVALDQDIRDNDERGGVFLHHSRVPLVEANLDDAATPATHRQCSLGMCLV